MRGRFVGKLARLRERRVETFGSHAHGYQLARPLDEAEVRVLEQQHGIELPASYRAFLREVGSSGAGPYYGLLPPERWGDMLYGDVAMPDFAARPCAWTPDGPRDFDRIAKQLDEPFQGAIAIADQGCAYYATLVVTGEARGRIMYVSMDGGAPFFTADADFASWYERWLDELLAGFKHFWYGTQMPGTEATFVAAARDADPARRLAALRAMGQLPAFSADTQAVIALRVRDDDAAVRAQALNLVKHGKLACEIEVHVRRALDDADAEVRTMALQALVAGGASWHDAARRALRDPDDKVASCAIRELEQAKALTEDDLLPLLGQPITRQAAHYAARTVPSQHIFDVTLADLRAHGDDKHSSLLHTLLAQVRLGAVDDARRADALSVLLDRIAAARGPDPDTLAIYGLGAIARKPDDLATRAVHALIDLLAHREPFFRFEAAAVLGDIAAVQALPALRALIDDPAMPRAASRSTAWSVGENARRAIAKIEAKLTPSA